MLLKSLTFVHELLDEHVRADDVVVDATAGNGHDTVALARSVGAEGRVHAFDVQEAAIEATRRRVEGAGVASRVQLHQIGHEHMIDVVPADERGEVRAVVFNLGYLPGSDRQVITRPETTVPALAAALDVLSPEGLVTVVCYTGHEGGLAEAEAVEAWAAGLEQERYRAVLYRFLNQRNCPPHAIIVEKR